MERLTQWFGDKENGGVAGIAAQLDGVYTPDELINVLLEALARYEDTGLSPEVCANYKAFEDEAISKGVTFKRIVELMEAERFGHLEIYPCSVGDTVFFIEKIQGVRTIREYIVVERGSDAETSYVVLNMKMQDGVLRRMGMPMDEFKANAFHSREVAEAALRKEKRE